MKKTMTIEMAAGGYIGEEKFFAMLELPAKPHEIQDACHKLRITANRVANPRMDVCSCEILPELTDVRLDSPSMEEMNFLAQRLGQLSDEEAIALRGVWQRLDKAGYLEEPVRAMDLINMTYGLENVMVASCVSNDRDLGEFVLENDLDEDIANLPDEMVEMLDQEAVGQRHRESEGGVFIGYHYVVAGEYQLQQVYDGIHLPAQEPEKPFVFRLQVAESPVNDSTETMGTAEWISLPIDRDTADGIAQKHNEAKDTAVYSTYEETVRRIYQLCLREVKKNRPESERIFESMDYDHARMKRRMEATLWSMEELHQRISSVYPDLPELPTAAECWAESNAIPSSAYDLEEEFKTGALGAAIWMLDQIKESGKLYELVQLLPSDADPHKLGMPEIWDPCHSTDVLAGMLQLIQSRNEDCTGLERQLKKEPGVVKRCYMDLYTTERLHKQDVPSRNRFEAAVSYIPEETIQAAVQYFMEKYWDFTVRYFQSHALLAHEEKQIRDDLAKFKTKSDIMMEKLQQMTRKELELPQAVQTPSVIPMRQPNIAVMTQGKMLNMTALSRRPDATQIITQMVAEENALDERSEVLQQKKTGLWADLRQYPIKGKGWFTENYSEEIAEIWDGFEAENPYAICFAFLYLLDSGSEIPWLYLPSGSVLSMAMDALPWTRTRYREDIEGIWNHFDEDCGEVLPGSGRVDLPKRIKVPELENWYRMEYMDRYEDDPEYQERYSLAQIMYEVTGCIMPRNPRRFYPALTEWDRYGINGKKALHPLVYSMSLLGEARQQSCTITSMDIDWVDEKPEVEQETDSVEELKAKIASLQGEVGQLRKTVYETSRELRETRKAAEAQDQKAELDRQELADLRELVFHLQEDVYDTEPEYAGIAFPYHNFQRIVVFGGHDSWAREIKPRLPDVRFVDKDMVPNAELIRRADIVWIQANAISHAFYYKILDETRKHSIPVRYFSYASALKCAEQLAEQDMKEAQK